jgi:hypothetical protein
MRGFARRRNPLEGTHSAPRTASSPIAKSAMLTSVASSVGQARPARRWRAMPKHAGRKPASLNFVAP